MDEKRFHERIKQILSTTKRGKYDSSTAEIHDAFHEDVLGKSGGAWNKDVATEVMKQIEWAFNVQPEVVEQAKTVKEPDVIKALNDYLIERGYKYLHIDEGSKKTPDGYIEGFDKRYLCEVKSPELKFDNSVGVYKFTSSHRQILNPIHTAKKQFASQDPKHEFPHILVYTSAHFQLNWKSFTDAIQGGVKDQTGKKLLDLINTHIYQATKNIIPEIDGYIWLQVGRNKQFYQVTYFLNIRSDRKGLVNELFTNLHKIKISKTGFDNTIEF